eukprot:2081144-Prymnesium_polylepis.1
MGLQRHVLEYPDFRVVVPPCGCRMKRPHAWVLGLVCFYSCAFKLSGARYKSPLEGAHTWRPP